MVPPFLARFRITVTGVLPEMYDPLAGLPSGLSPIPREIASHRSEVPCARACSRLTREVDALDATPSGAWPRRLRVQSLAEPTGEMAESLKGWDAKFRVDRPEVFGEGLNAT